MKLFLDAGNTRIKWQLREKTEVITSGAFSLDSFSSTITNLANYVLRQGSPLEVVAVSSVLGGQDEQDMDYSIKALLGLSCRFAKVKREFDGLRIAYDHLDNLGVDRWLILLALHRRYPGCNNLVVGAGSAITADYLGADGGHLGGLIVPGVRLMKDALFSRTAAVKVESLTLPQNWVLGCDTLPCVENGVAAMLKGFAEQITNASSCFEGSGLQRVVLTGGDAEVLRPYFGADAQIIESLVVEGLVIAEENNLLTEARD